MKTILVVDDEPKIVKLVRDYLERAGFGVRVAADGKSALSLVLLEKPDMVILDLGLPQMDGLDVMREVRKLSNVPILLLTGRSEESDKLIGLEMGADDYITKPFSPKELVARVRVVFRRMENVSSDSQEILRVAEYSSVCTDHRPLRWKKHRKRSDAMNYSMAPLLRDYDEMQLRASSSRLSSAFLLIRPKPLCEHWHDN